MAAAALAITESFNDSLANLQPAEQAQALVFFNQFQRDPSQPGISLERLKGDDTLWSGRVTQDLRVILYRDVSNHWIALYVDHHDAAYRWAERRSAARHPKTGVIQVVETEVRTETKTVVVPRVVQAPLFAHHGGDYLFSLGVPEAVMPVLLEVRTEEELLELVEHVPRDVGERLLRLADGEVVVPPLPVPADEPVAARDDLRYLFYVVEGEDDLARVLRAPLEKWITFLHPSQRALVEGAYSGPVKVSGAAGTGKTVVALHRARHLAGLGHRVLVTTYVTTLVKHLSWKADLLCSPQERTRIRVSTVLSEALAAAKQVAPTVAPGDDTRFEAALRRAAPTAAPGLEPGFVVSEWHNVIDRHAVADWEHYRAIARVGRERPLRVEERRQVWEAVEAARRDLEKDGLVTWTDICGLAAAALAEGQAPRPYDAVIVDELQDLTAAQLAFVRELAGGHPEHLMLVGDAGQRIYSRGFSLASVGLPVRGRAHILRLNYRSTNEIQRAAERVIGGEVDDMDDGRESRKGVRSLFHGPEPELAGLDDAEAERRHVAARVRGWLAAGIEPAAIGVFARTNDEVSAVGAALADHGIRCLSLTSKTPVDGSPDRIRLGTMHRAKGLEFKAVAVAGCRADLLPAPKALRVEEAVDREAALAGERQLLYVAMTRARDELLVTWSAEPSPFLAALLAERPA